MKKAIAIITFILIGVSAFAQEANSAQRLKYVTYSPEGTELVTLYDSPTDNKMKLQSASSFYKYQILDTDTLEVLYELDNNGKECTIDKTKLDGGTYSLRLFTSKSVITSKIEISKLGNL